MKQFIIITLLITSFSNELKACECTRPWNDSFKKTIKTSNFVALVKIISFDSYVGHNPSGGSEKTPYSMTVEIIRKFKGKEQRKRVTIYGDDGMLCRPYLTAFEINKYYLISPNALEKSSKTDYYFFLCRTEFLKVDLNKNKVFGRYSFFQNSASINSVERVCRK
ncbi:hypothetical protein [Flammeovirga sp. SJP92]|uniref:hypothetical protein n=1 Tax=Flammeovirga sp. SJP92 TaxID=1775430 RepID=UPI0007873257|nr:hypothetical protein [Flammeovirga sp. SJP92]KXX71171.1 hypothetical protein AVL50_10080 [Flammeovirga sp. SJP92]